MRLLHSSTHSRQRISSSRLIARTPTVEKRAQLWPDQMETRHDAQMLITRSQAADPYAAWLQEREADRQRSRQDARDVWDDLRRYCS